MSTNINISSSGIENRFAKSTKESSPGVLLYPNSYICGTAKLNTPEATTAWTLVLIEVAVNGTVTTKTCDTSPASWANAQTYTFS